MDSALRRRQRRGEATTLDLVRAGLVTQERLELAARVRASEWIWPDRRRLVREATELLGPTLPARLASDYAARLPQSEEGVAAIAAARAWAEEPTEARRLAACAAAAAAYAASAYSAYPAATAADVAYTAAWAAAASAANAAAWAAADAAAHAAADRETEHHWQRERLAIYLESPGWPPVEATPLKETP